MFGIHFKDQGKQDKQSHQVHKKLCIVSSEDKVESLNLKRSMIQTLLKKQSHQRLYRLPLEKEKGLSYGIVGSKLEIVRGGYHFMSRPFSKIDDEKYGRIMRREKRMKELLIDSGIPSWARFVKNLPCLRNLQSLTIALAMGNFINFAQSLRYMSHLQKLSIVIKSDPQNAYPEEQKLENAVSLFCQILASRKHLISFKLLSEKSEIIWNEKTEATFFGCLGEIDLPNFDLQFHANPDDIFNTSHCEKFLQKVEYLGFSQLMMIHETPLQNKRFSIYRVQNCGDIISKCNSLQRLDYRLTISEITGNIEPLRKVKEFSFNIPSGQEQNKLNIAGTFCQLVSEMSHLEKLSLYINWEPFQSEQLRQIHLFLSQSQNLKFYNLTISIPYGKTHPDMSVVCEDIIKLQSLESLGLTITGGEGEILSPIGSILFPNFPKLKALNISFTNYGKYDLHLENLSFLESIEELKLRISNFDKAAILKRLPKLPSIKKLELMPDSFLPDPKEGVSIEDYKKRFTQEEK